MCSTWELTWASAQGLDLRILTLLKATSQVTTYGRPTLTCISAMKPRPEPKSYSQAGSIVTLPENAHPYPKADP